MGRTALLLVFILVTLLGEKSAAQQKPIHSQNKAVLSKQKSSPAQPLSLTCLKSGMLAKVALDHLVQAIERHAFDSESDWDAVQIEERGYKEDVDKADAIFKADISAPGDNGAYLCYLSYENETIEMTLDRAKARLSAVAAHSKMEDWWSPHQSSLFKFQSTLDKVFSIKGYSGECGQK
jgi:hypothetical protein